MNLYRGALRVLCMGQVLIVRTKRTYVTLRVMSRNCCIRNARAEQLVQYEINSVNVSNPVASEFLFMTTYLNQQLLRIVR